MRRSIQGGLLIGVLTGGWMWAEFALGLHTTHHDIGRYTGALALMFPVLGLILVLRRVRQQEGQMTFRLALRHGLVLSAAAALAMGAMSWVYALWIHPAWIAQVPGASAAGFALQSGLSAFLGGSLLAVILGALMRRRPASGAVR